MNPNHFLTTWRQTRSHETAGMKCKQNTKNPKRIFKISMFSREMSHWESWFSDSDLPGLSLRIIACSRLVVRIVFGFCYPLPSLRIVFVLLDCLLGHLGFCLLELRKRIMMELRLKSSRSFQILSKTLGGFYFFHLHAFACFLQAPLFFIYMFLTDPLFFHLHVSYRPPFLIYMFLTGPLFSFTCFLQAPFFHLHVFFRPPFFIYKILQGFKYSVPRLFVALGRIIYTFFT